MHVAIVQRDTAMLMHHNSTYG